MNAHRVARSAGVAVLVIASVCACTPTGPAAPTTLTITTTLTICGGAVPPPGQPACRTNPTAAAVAVSQDDVVVKSATTGTSGTVEIAVPAGTYVVSRTDAPAYLICDTPTVTAIAGTTTAAVQDCVLDAP